MIKKLLAHLSLLRIETELDDLAKATRHVQDEEILFLASRRREALRKDQAKARADLTALYPPGVRFTWEQA